MAIMNRNLPLGERIKSIQAEIDAVIDAKAEAVSKDSPGVPLGVIRNLITARATGCQCRQYLEIMKQDEAV